jgi:hypothetical protein
VNVAYVVQHHPSRADLLPRLLPHLHEAVVVTDPDSVAGLPDPWRCYLACLRALPLGATHLVIVQDDALPCPDFHLRVESLLEEKPDRIVCLFVSQAPNVRVAMLRALKNGQAWARLNPQGFTPVVCSVLPREVVEGLTEWADALPPNRHRRSDDFMLSQYAREKRLEVWACVPSICDHDDSVPSLIGARAGQRHRQAVALA